MMKFIKFILIWISQQLAIPFWMVGHFHLSLGMNVVVAIGFWLDWKQYSTPKIDHTKRLQEQINHNKSSLNKTSSVVNKVIDEISQMKVYK